MAESEYYEDMINSMTPHERKHALKPSRMDLKGGHHHRRNYCICNMCGHWFRRNKGIHDEDKYGPIHICGGVCDELAIQSANLEADVGGGFQANYWDQEEIEEWKKKNGKRKMKKYSWYTNPVKVTDYLTVYQYAVDREIFLEKRKDGSISFILVKKGTYVTRHDGGWQRYKPNMKGGHTHNHLKNMELRLMLSKKEIKALRKIMKREKKNGRN